MSRRSLFLVAVLIAVLVSATIVGCGTKKNTGLVSGNVGEPVDVGDWTITVQKGSTFETATADNGQQYPVIRVPITLANNSEQIYESKAEAFQLLAENGNPLVTDDSAELNGPVEPGKSAEFSGIFMVPQQSGKYTLVFTPFDGGPGRAEIELP